MKRKLGRPTAYSEELAASICLAIATRTVGLRKICKENKNFPSPCTLYRWIMANDAFRTQYAHAREFQAQALFDEIVEIADTPRMGTVVKVDPKGRKSIRTSDMTEHRKLQIDARKWALSKLLPQRFGDRVSLDTGQDPLSELLEEMQKESQRIGPPLEADVKLLQ